MRCFCSIGLGLVVLIAARPSAQAAEPQMNEAATRAATRALEWLAAKQNVDGSWSGSGQYAHNTALTSFALLAFMSQGHLPNQGPYGPEVARGCRFLLASARPDGYLIGAHGGNMYSHGMTTLALAELWGMAGDQEVKPVLEKAVQLIIRSQHPDGGWRYEPNPAGDSDISVTIMQVMALRAAKNSGLDVPDATLKHAIEYINKCYHAQSGGFCYQPHQQPGFARTAAGACVLQLTGEYTAQQIPRAVEYLKKNNEGNPQFWWYGQYYASHALHQVGGKDWEDWYNKVSKELVAHQAADGSWTDWHNEGIGPVYHTAIAVIILSVPADYLPIFQR